MGHGQFVGRVGALAVALGVGMLAPAVAGADTDTDSTAAANADTAGAEKPGVGTQPSKSPQNPSSNIAEAADDDDAPVSIGGSQPVVIRNAGGSDADGELGTDVEADGAADSNEDDVAAQELPESTKPGSGAHRKKKVTERGDVIDQQTRKASPPAPSSVADVSARTDREARRPLRPEVPDMAAAAATVPVALATPSAREVPARVTASVPVAVLGALGLPVEPLSPSSDGLLRDLMWGAYRRTESEEDEQISTLAATPMTTMAMAAAAAPSGPSVNYAVGDDWGQGFVGNMTVNAGDSPMNGWTVEFDTPAQITNIWNAEIASHTATHYVVRNAAWNGQVGAGQATSFGFQGSGVSSSITNLTVNGVPTGQPTPPSVSVADASVSEGNSGTSNLNFNVTLSKASTSPVTIAYTTANGTATAGQDYTAKSGTVTFAAGETTKTVSVAVAGDTAVEPNETLTVTLSNPSGATIADGSAVGTITNDDVQVTPPSVSVADASVSEGNRGQAI